MEQMLAQWNGRRSRRSQCLLTVVLAPVAKHLLGTAWKCARAGEAWRWKSCGDGSLALSFFLGAHEVRFPA